MDAATISAGLSALKTAMDLVKGLLATKGEAGPRVEEVLEKMGNVQDLVYSLRDDLMKCQEENFKLKTDAQARDEWSERAKRYELTRTEGGAIVYRSSSPPLHFACPTCFEKKQVGILQPWCSVSGNYHCPACSAEYSVDRSGSPVYFV